MNKSQYAVLGVLSLEPMSGYDVKKFIEQSLGNFWNESFGQIYPVLKSLEKKGFATKKTHDQGKKTVYNYSITALGLKQLKQWLVEPAEPVSIRNEFLLKIFFGNHIPPQMSVQHIEAFCKRTEALLLHYQKIEKEIKQEKKNSSASLYWFLTVRFGIHSAKALLSWGEEALGILREEG